VLAPHDQIDAASTIPSQAPFSRALRRPFESALAALVGVVNETAIGAATVQRHVQRVDDELGAHVIGHRPANDRAGVGVLNGGEVQPALPGAQVGDVGEPQHVRGSRPELALNKVISDPDAGHDDRCSPALAWHKA
jgi:hypothetical protein